MSANAQMTARGDAMYYVHSFSLPVDHVRLWSTAACRAVDGARHEADRDFLGLLYGWILSTSSGRAWPDCLRSCWWAA